MFPERLDYTFQLPAFEGPLDLLLKLIEREELDITEIALAQVADQYLAYVRALEAPDPDALSAFLVMAARLLLIKSRALLPRPPAPAGPDQPRDEAGELAHQLREYQRYKQAAMLLRAWEEQGRRSYLRLAPPPKVPPAPILPRQEKLDVTLGDMIAAVQRRMQLLLPLEPPELPLPAPKVITVAEMADRIRARLQAQAWLSFEDVLSLAARRVEVVVALWSVLELLKRRAIVVEQEELFGAIMIGRGPNLDDAPLLDLESDDALANGSND